MTTEHQVPGEDGFYVQDVDFLSGVVPNQTPLIMAVAAALNGYAPPSVNGRFSYCDLGCGDGTTVCALAAVNPQAFFHGVDFNEGHVEKGRQSAAELGLDNVTFIQAGFESLKDHELPQFDLVAMNGIYAWLENKPLQGTQLFLTQHLRPGGLFYVEYTSMPGMAAVPPLWKLIRELVPARGLSSRERAEKGLEMLQTLAKRGLGYLAANPRAAQAARHYVAGVKNDPKRLDHFLHNAMASGFRPRYVREMAAEMRECGLNYAGRTSLGLNIVEMSVPPGQVPTFRDIEDPLVQESLKDYIRNEQNRRDVFIKEANPDAEGAGKFLLESLRLLGRNAPADMQRAVPVIGNHQVGLRGPLFDALFQGFEDQPRPLSEVDCPESPRERLISALGKLIGSNQFFLCLDRPVGKAGAVERPVMPLAMNRWLLDKAAREIMGVNLVSCLTGGAAMTFSPVEVMLLSEALTHGFDGCVAAAAQKFSQSDKMLPVKGKMARAGTIAKEDLANLLELMRGRKLHNMVKLGIIENAS